VGLYLVDPPTIHQNKFSELFSKYKYKMPTTYVQLTNPRFARGTAKRLKGSASGRKNLKTAMKRTSKRGAYAKNKKKAMQIRRAPLVETKSRIQSEIALGTQIPQSKDFAVMKEIFNFLPLHAYTCMEQGLGESQMVGNSVFSKYLNAKVQIRFPGAQNLITDRHFPMELVCGWIPSSLLYSTFTTPPVNSVSPSDISTFITQRVAEYFNARTDRLDFIPKKASNLRITYRKKIRPNLSKSTVAPASAYDQAGFIPDVMLHPKWTTNRKIHYEEGNTYGDGAGIDRRNFFPNYSWIPFMVLYQPMARGEGGDTPLADAKCPRVSYNVAHYYSDS
jgi:hypothetical protein